MDKEGGRDDAGGTPAYVDQQQMNWAQPSLQYGLEVEDIILTIKMNLLNEMYGEDGSFKKIEGTESLINMTGLSCLMTRVRSALNRNTFLSNFDIHEYSKLMEQIANEVVIDIGLNWREWGIKRGNRNAVKMTIIQPIMCALKRPVDEGEKKYLQPMHRFVEKRDVGEEGERKKRFGIF